MITSLQLVNFKNFADETLKLGPFTVIVGANASGKSNIRDAFLFLHGISRGYTLAEAMGGRLGAGGHVEWEPIRGAPNAVIRFGQTRPQAMGEFTVRADLDLNGQQAHYALTVGINPDALYGFRVLWELLTIDGVAVIRTVVSEPDWDFIPEARPGLTRPLVDASPYDEMRTRLCSALGSMRFLELSPERMREPAIPGASSLGDSGQNLPTALEAICAHHERRDVLASWLRELTPMDVESFAFPRDPNGRVHLRIVERNGSEVSADSASDGTLRFLAMLAMLLSEDTAGIYFFEDIDNGIHPSRLRLLLEFIEGQTVKNQVQVITTTHSPALLAWMNDTTFKHTSVVYRDEYRSDSVIRPIADLYNLQDLRHTQGLDRLFTSGWLETAMHFSEGEADTDHLPDDEEDWDSELDNDLTGDTGDGEVS